MCTKWEIINKYHDVLDHIQNVNIKSFPGHPEPLFLISNTYPGVWLEHVYDSVLWAQLCPEMAYVARAAVELFLDNQKPDGQLPCFVLDESNPSVKGYGSLVGYGQLQECVAFARLCFEAAQLNHDDRLLARAYDGCARWVDWLRAHRMTLGKGLVELFCVFDTGHDNSVRLAGIPSDTPGSDARMCNKNPELPIFAPDINAVFYDTLTALADMADALGKPEEAPRWRSEAEQVRAALDAMCYDPETDFYYDADRNGVQRRCKSISITNLFAAHYFNAADAARIFRKHLMNPDEFWTKYPFPSLAANDPLFQKRIDRNDWGYFSMGLTAERSLRWMDFYGFGAELEDEMRAWLDAVTRSDTPFGQDMDPFTGEFTGGSPWYSATMLFYVAAVRRVVLREPMYPAPGEVR